jgi:hypothetical protein
MAARRPVVNVGGTLQELPLGDTTAGPFAVLQIEALLCTTARKGGRFTVAGAGFTVGAPVVVHQARAAYTGKGVTPDEAEMDAVTATGAVISTTQISCVWSSPTRVIGNRKFNILGT